MSVNASKIHTMIDAGDSIAIRTHEDSAETNLGYTGETSIPIRRLTTLTGDDKPLEKSSDVTGSVRDINTSGSAAYWLIASTQINTGSPLVEIARQNLTTTKGGTFRFTIDANLFPSNATLLTFGTLISGTPRSINYDARLQPSASTPGVK
jgi:hypothetical protein